MGATASSSAGANRSADSVNSAAVDMAATRNALRDARTVVRLRYCSGPAAMLSSVDLALGGPTCASRCGCSCPSWHGCNGHCSCRGRVATGAVG